MCKTIFLGDLHQGASNDDTYLREAQTGFFEFLCEYAKQRGITRLVQTGDWFDDRKGISQDTIRYQRTYLIPLLESVFDEIIVLPGNHDLHFKNKITPNSVTEMFSDRPIFKVIESPQTVLLGQVTLDVIPWICTENEEQIKQFIAESQSDMCVGHFELDGFEFYKGVPSSGESMEFLCDYKKVYSGHYHTRSKHGNVEYIGTPYTLTMGDANDERGFVVFDSTTSTDEFVPNPECNHFRIHYNAEFSEPLSKYENKRVTIVIEESDDRLDAVLTTLEQICNQLTKKDVSMFQVNEVGETELKQQNTLKVIESLIEHSTIDNDVKSKVKSHCQRLYTLASKE